MKLSTPDGDAERDGLFAWGQKFSVEEGGDASLVWSPPLSTRVLQLWQLAAIAGLLYLATRRSSLPTPTRRKRVVARADPLVVVDGPGSKPEDWASSGDPSRSTEAEEPGGEETQ